MRTLFLKNVGGLLNQSSKDVYYSLIDYRVASFSLDDYMTHILRRCSYDSLKIRRLVENILKLFMLNNKRLRVTSICYESPRYTSRKRGPMWDGRTEAGSKGKGVDKAGTEFHGADAESLVRELTRARSPSPSPSKEKKNSALS